MTISTTTSSVILNADGSTHEFTFNFKNKRIKDAEEIMQHEFNEDQMEFINFVLSQYENEGVLVLDDEKLPILLELKYKSLQNAKQILGDLTDARNIFLVIFS